MQSFVRSYIVMLASLSGLGCGAVAREVRPDERSPTEALDPNANSCVSVGDYAEPLVVDWPPHARANLTEAMQAGVAVVAHDCGSLRLLRGCSAEGSYSFLGVPRDDQILTFEDLDEVRANIPIGVLAGQVEAELTRGSTLDVATILAGKQRTTVTELPRSALRGGEACNGATHFLKGTFVGAFATRVHSEGTAATTLSILAEAQGQSRRTNEHRAGMLAACDHLQPNAPTMNCDAIMRLELVALDQPIHQQTTGVQAAALDVSSVLSPCPTGMVFSGGKCTRSASPRLCRKGDAKDCSAQCRAGDQPSCNNLAVLQLKGEGAPQDVLFAGAMFQQSCDGGIALACRNLGLMYVDGRGIEKNVSRAAELFQRACDGGDMGGCFRLGHATVLGEGVAPDVKRGAELLQRACDGGSPTACAELAVMYGNGLEGTQDRLKQVLYYQRACDGWSSVCALLGLFYETGFAGPRDVVRAKASYKQACDGGEKFGCIRLKEIDTKPVSPEQFAAWTRTLLPGGAASGAPAPTSAAPTSAAPTSGAPATAAPATNDVAPPTARAEGGRVRLMGDILFEGRTANFRRGSNTEQALNDLAHFLKANPRVKQVRIEAHTDSLGTESESMALSGQRARRVKQYLVNQGVDASRLLAVGFGEHMPIADNHTPGGPSKNMRVNVVMIHEEGQPPVTDPSGGGKVF